MAHVWWTFASKLGPDEDVQLEFEAIVEDLLCECRDLDGLEWRSLPPHDGDAHTYDDDDIAEVAEWPNANAAMGADYVR